MIEEVESTNDAAEQSELADGATATQAADNTPTGPDDSSAEATETVDELEDRVRDLQGAMEKIQSGDLDGAEQAIEALEERIASTRD